MKEKSVKLQRSESLLQEVITEALALLEDSRLSSLSVIAIDCSKGKYHADVYLDAPSADAQERKEILRQLKLAEGAIRASCLSATGWFRCPQFHFHFDDSLDKTQRLEAIFAQLHKEHSS